MRNKRVAIIGTAGVPARYGGFETLAEYLVKNLSSKYDITVYCSAKNYEKKLNSYNGANLKYININANGFQSIFYDIVSIFDSLKYADTLLILGISGCIILPLLKYFALKNNKKIIVNIDGIEWKRKKWGIFAKYFLKLSEKMTVKYADVVVSDNLVIKNYIKSKYNIDSMLITYGGDHVKKEAIDHNLITEYPFLKEKYAFKVARIEPENNIHLILEAFSEFKELNLVLVGNWDKSRYGQELRKKYHSFSNIFLLDPIYDQKILNAIRSNCFVYIHGHSAGGTNPSLVEAMYLGLPIIAYGVEYNKVTTQYKALYFMNKNELLKLINEIISNIDLLANIGQTMQEIAIREYTWENVAKEYDSIF
jgi:glycosyltransferase involved in cell wall biosynthesis